MLQLFAVSFYVGGVIMKLALTIIFLVVSVILSVIVLMQEGKQSGLSAAIGGGETYWSKNKGRSKEGMLVKVTTVLAILFLVLAALISSKLFS